MSSGLAAFPATLQSGTVVGRVAIGAGPAEAVALAALWAALNGSSYVGQIVTKRKIADQSISSSTVLANDSDLLFSIAANEEWLVQFQISISGTLGSTGIKVAVTTPTGATLEADAMYMGGSVSTTLSGRSSVSGTPFLNFVPADSTAVVNGFVWILNGATAGTLNLQFAQNLSNAIALTFRKGSFMQATRIG
jgi:hypothetical protein